MSVAMLPTPTVAAHRPTFAASKFAVPSSGTTWVERRVLLDRLVAAHDTPLTLVIGSPGSGKSSLLAQWARTQPPSSTVWLGCDQGDRDPVRFWHAFVASAARSRPEFASDCLDMLALNDDVDHDLLEGILAACESLDQPLAFVLDDFQLAGPSVHEHVQFIATRGLGRARLLIGSRVEPSIGLDRLRLTTPICEIRENDLRFSASDAASLLDLLGVQLDGDDLGVIVERTEGWVAGLQLAAIALRSAERRPEVVAKLDESNELIRHYLWSEVFKAQTSEVQRFLLDTSIVDELSPGLAAALSPGTPVTLRDIEAANLLLVRLDSSGHTFRYHHLLADMLRERLRSDEPRHELILHQRAARWFVDQGEPAAAFRHRWRAGQRTAAIATMHGIVLDAYHDETLPTLDEGERSLTDDDLTAVPGPATSFSAALLTAGFPDDADRLASRIDVLAGHALDPKDRRQLGAVRCMAALALGDTGAAIAQGRALVDEARDGPADDEWSALGLSGLARALAWEGDHDEANTLVATTPLRPRVRTAQAELQATIAFCRLMSGELSEAIRIADDLRNELARTGAAEADVILHPTALIGSALLERGRLGEAEHALRQVSDARSTLRVPVRVLSKVGLSRLARAEGDYDAAFAILDDALHLVRRRPPGSGIVDLVRARQALVLIDSGQDEPARRLVDAIASGYTRSLLTTRLALALERLDDAQVEIDVLAAIATTTRQRLYAQLARLALAAHRDEPVDEIADGVLDVASSEGFVFPIAEAGSVILDAVRRSARRRTMSADTATLMSIRPCTPPPSSARPRPFESLTDRERAVLRCLATSMTYNEIAVSLGVSVNTVKTHAKNITRKLQATSRADALSRARELRYL